MEEVLCPQLGGQSHQLSHRSIRRAIKNSDSWAPPQPYWLNPQESSLRSSDFIDFSRDSSAKDPAPAGGSEGLPWFWWAVNALYGCEGEDTV